MTSISYKHSPLEKNVMSKKLLTKTYPHGQKMPDSVLSPIDKAILNFFNLFKHRLYKMGITPNMLTTVSVIFSLLAIYFVFKKRFKLAAIAILLNYCFDSFDGNMARSFKMESKFGDYYDHVSDVIFYAGLSVAFWFVDIHYKTKLMLFAIVVIFTYLSAIYFGCGEKLNKNHLESETLNGLKKYCNEVFFAKYSKWIGGGSVITMICIIVFNLQYIDYWFSLKK